MTDEQLQAEVERKARAAWAAGDYSGYRPTADEYAAMARLHPNTPVGALASHDLGKARFADE